MKQLTSYNRVAGYLNKVFDLLNAEFFESELSRPTITIQSTPKAYGHFSLREDTWVSKIEALKELEALIEEAKTEAEALRDEIKAEMMNRNTEEMEAGQYIVRWTSVLSQRFDSTAFKKVMPDVYKSFIKQTASRRFSISA